MLTYREQLGHQWEWECITQLRDKVEYVKHNPVNPVEWKRDVSKGSDMLLYVNDTFIDVECKSNYAPVYRSWVERSHLPRFMVKDIRYKVILTNNKQWYGDECKALYKEHGVLLLDMDGLLNLIQWIKGVTSSITNVMYSRGVSVVNGLLSVFRVIKHQLVLPFLCLCSTGTVSSYHLRSSPLEAPILTHTTLSSIRSLLPLGVSYITANNISPLSLITVHPISTSTTTLMMKPVTITQH